MWGLNVEGNRKQSKAHGRPWGTVMGLSSLGKSTLAYRVIIAKESVLWPKQAVRHGSFSCDCPPNPHSGDHRAHVIVKC